MARTTINIQQIVASGLEMEDEPVNGADGNQFQNDGRVFLEFDNADAASQTATILTQAAMGGYAVADQVVTIPAGEKRKAGPFPPNLFNVNGYAQIDYSDGANLTVAAVRL